MIDYLCWIKVLYKGPGWGIWLSLYLSFFILIPFWGKINILTYIASSYFTTYFASYCLGTYIGTYIETYIESYTKINTLNLFWEENQYIGSHCVDFKTKCLVLLCIEIVKESQYFALCWFDPKKATSPHSVHNVLITVI